MSDLVADLLICLLLLAGVGFGGISLMGLLIFPDIHSRMYTALRASLICVAILTGASAVYALALLGRTGSGQYATFLIHALFLAGMIAVGIMIINRQVLDKTRALVYCGNAPANPADRNEPKP
jgi:multicomponent Na+:H+ antiporter subunit G